MNIVINSVLCHIIIIYCTIGTYFTAISAVFILFYVLLKSMRLKSNILILDPRTLIIKKRVYTVLLLLFLIFSSGCLLKNIKIRYYEILSYKTVLIVIYLLFSILMYFFFYFKNNIKAATCI